MGRLSPAHVPKGRVFRVCRFRQGDDGSLTSGVTAAVLRFERLLRLSDQGEAQPGKAGHIRHNQTCAASVLLTKFLSSILTCIFKLVSTTLACCEVGLAWACLGWEPQGGKGRHALGKGEWWKTRSSGRQRSGTEYSRIDKAPITALRYHRDVPFHCTKVPCALIPEVRILPGSPSSPCGSGRCGPRPLGRCFAVGWCSTCSWSERGIAIARRQVQRSLHALEAAASPRHGRKRR